jgi:hypothetical protein
MYRRPIFCTLFSAVDFENVLKKWGRPAPLPEYLLTQHSCKEAFPPLLHTTTHNKTQQHYTTALGYIKLPMYMYQLFLWRLYLMVLKGATSLLGALEGVGPDVQGPPLPMPLAMMLHPSKPLNTAP